MINTWSLGFYLIRAQPPLSIILLLTSWCVCGGGRGPQLPPASTIRARLFQFWSLATTHHTAETISPLTFLTLGFPGDSDGSLPAMRETWVRSLGQEDPLEKKMAIRSSILAWKMPWTGGAWRATVDRLATSQIRLSDFTLSLYEVS